MNPPRSGYLALCRTSCPVLCRKTQLLAQPGRPPRQVTWTQAFAAGLPTTSSHSNWTSSWVAFCGPFNETIQLCPPVEDPLADLRAPEQSLLSISPERGRVIGNVDRIQAQVSDRLSFRQQLRAWLRRLTRQYRAQELRNAGTTRKLSIPVHVISSSTGRRCSRRRLVNMKSSLAACLTHLVTLTHSDIEQWPDVVESAQLLRTAEKRVPGTPHRTDVRTASVLPSQVVDGRHLVTCNGRPLGIGYVEVPARVEQNARWIDVGLERWKVGVFPKSPIGQAINYALSN